MEAVAHSPEFAKKAGVPTSVGKDFVNADKGRKFSKGGIMAKSDMKEDMKADKKQDVALIKKAFKQHDMQEHKGSKGTMLKLAKGGYTRAADGVATKGKTKAKQITMKRGGMC
jgi:hypothetical protein